MAVTPVKIEIPTSAKNGLEMFTSSISVPNFSPIGLRKIQSHRRTHIYIQPDRDTRTLFGVTDNTGALRPFGRGLSPPPKWALRARKNLCTVAHAKMRKQDTSLERQKINASYGRVQCFFVLVSSGYSCHSLNLANGIHFRVPSCAQNLVKRLSTRNGIVS